MSRKKLIILTGPTGIGKTDLSIELAQALGTEIVSCDSRQMYRELQIGAAPPSAEQLAKVKHYFIGNLSVTDYYSAGRFELQALDLLDTLFATHDKVLMVGGSGMYIDAVVQGIDDLPTASPEIREMMMQRLKNEGIDALRAELAQLDPDYYNAADIVNPKRVLKALEVIAQTGKTYSSLRTGQGKQRPFDIVMVGLTMDRQKLYDRIDSRVDAMLAAGLEAEVRNLHQYKHLNSLNTVGYKEFFGYFDGEYDFDEAVRLIKRNSRRYAKKQMTWFNRYPQMHWFDRADEKAIFDFVLNQ